MAVREFKDTDVLVLDDGDVGALANGPHSVVMVMRWVSTPTATDTVYMYARANADGSGGSPLLLYNDNVQSVSYASDSSDTPTNIGQNIGNAWMIFGATKASGTVAPIFHHKVLGSGSWAHTTSGITAANVATDVGSFRFSDMGTTGFRIAAMAVYDQVLSSAQFESIQTTPASATLSTLGAVELWDFNQASTGTAIESLTGSSTQTSLSGSVVVSDDDPTWTFGLGAVSGVTLSIVV
jgi:hypothetical protein